MPSVRCQPRTKKFRQILLLGFFVLLGCTNSRRDGGPSASGTAPGSPDESDVSSAQAPEIAKSDFVTGLSQPWDLAFASDGTMYFTEKCRGLSVRAPDGSRHFLFGSGGSQTSASDLFCQGQSGMAGVALDPEFDRNRRIYLFMTSKISSPPTNRVVRLTVNPDNAGVTERTDIITDVPYKNRSNSHGSAGSHSGGRIRFGPDGFLYVLTGDNHNGKIPQDLSSLGGKVLRVTTDGQPAPGNNPTQGADPRIFTYGHRNSQGLSFRPGTGQPYLAEHGPGHTDEVTPLVAGGNGGWDPAPEAGVICLDNYCGYGSNKADGRRTPMTDIEKFPNAMRPIWENDGDSDGLSPAQFLTGAQWGRWNGSLAVGLLAGRTIKILEIDDGGRLRNVSELSVPKARIRSLVQGPDGNLYVVTDDGDIWKIMPR